MAHETTIEMSCANCGRTIPDEQPESIRGFCNDRCKRQSEKEDAPRHTVTEGEMEEHLRETLLESNDIFDSVETFAESSLLSRNHGLVVRTVDGREFQITIVRSR